MFFSIFDREKISKMKNILSYIITPVYLLIFALLLVIFHPVQMFTNWIWGYPVRKKVVDVLNFCLLYSLWILGTRITFRGFEKIPQNRPLIIVANHQTLLDIVAIVVGFRKNHPKFISKAELGKGIPSVSYNLRHGGSVLIDRKKGAQSVKDIMMLGKHIEKETYAACIFPEGTRTKDGSVKTFQPAGVASLIRTAPSAIVVPLAIDGNYDIMKKGYYPIKLGGHLKFTVLDPIEPKGLNVDELTLQIENMIKRELGQESLVF